jgi:DNA invertase Pin-like site-specific DNA recombinase
MRDITSVPSEPRITVAYLRTATRSADGYNAISRQGDRCARYAASVGLRLDRLYADQGWSGARGDRPALTDLLRDLDIGSIDFVIVPDASRLARGYALERLLAAEIRRCEATVLVADGSAAVFTATNDERRAYANTEPGYA